MTIQESLKSHSSTEIELLLSHVLGKPKEFLFMNPGLILTSKHLNILTRLIKRRQKGEPIAYVLGYKDFCGLRFKVNRDVLIPRPETEWMVEKATAGAERLASRPATGKTDPLLPPFKIRGGGKGDIKILDVGTGSGNIVISLAKELSNLKNCTNVQFFRLFASDISAKALKVARQNAKNHRVKINFIKSDLLANIKLNPDIIIANLPYVPVGDSGKLSPSLKYEPKQALFAQEKGLKTIKRLLKQIASRKSKPHLIHLEFDPRQKSVLAEIVKKNLLEGKIKFYKDFNGLWRYLEISF